MLDESRDKLRLALHIHIHRDDEIPRGIAKFGGEDIYFAEVLGEGNDLYPEACSCSCFRTERVASQLPSSTKTNSASYRMLAMTSGMAS